MTYKAVEDFSQSAKKTIDFLLAEFGGLQVGIASPALVENIMVDSYGASQPLKSVASIGVEGGTTLLISPWDKGLLKAIEKAIIDDTSLGLSPQNDGVGIRLNIPPLTKERRQELTKVASKYGEESKVKIRKARQNAMDIIKSDDDLSEDMQKLEEKNLQDLVTKVNKDIETSVKEKQASILKV